MKRLERPVLGNYAIPCRRYKEFVLFFTMSFHRISNQSVSLSAVDAMARRMKLVTEYIADAIQFEHLAELEQDPERRAVFENQAAAYRKQAVDRAKKLGLPPPEKRQSRPS
jgi:hypothetical protein